MKASFGFAKVSYRDLNAKQQENYNFHKIAAILADYGFTSIKLSDDWNDADFIALHTLGETLKVQLKGRFGFHKKYMGKELWLACPLSDSWCIYPHDMLLEQVSADSSFMQSQSWCEQGVYHWAEPSAHIKQQLQPWLVS